MQFCFSYRGYLPDALKVRTYVALANGDTRDENIYLTLSPDDFPSSPNSWIYKCINMFEFFTQDSPYAEEGIEFVSSEISLESSDDDLWIDEVSIQQQQNQSTVICMY